MKLSALLLPLLALTLVQPALSTHLETCECHQIRQLVNSTVQEAVAGLENRLSLLLQDTLHSINTTDSSALDQLETRLITTVAQLLKPIQQQLDYHLPLPKPINSTEPPQPSKLINDRNHPATSCKALHQQHPLAPSGYYWMAQSGSPVRVYCSMGVTCGSETGGWMRVADIDMRNTSQSCPSGLSFISSPKRLCDVGSYPACVSNSFNAEGVQYSRVCGKDHCLS